jgi:acylphosphatase
MKNRSVKVTISGMVQGVFFRASTSDMAIRKGLKGWVRNLRNGNVEAIFEGPEDVLKEAVAWCNHGPRGASVIEVRENWGSYSGQFDRFEIRY